MTTTTAPTLAYHGRTQLKTDTIGMMRGHREADRLRQGFYSDGEGQDFRGCAVGCMTGGNRHHEYPARWGIPVELAHLEDFIFERLDMELARAWPEAFLTAIPVGADLSLVWARTALWMLSADGPMKTDPAKASNEVRAAVAAVCALFAEWVDTGLKPVLERWDVARSKARSAAAAYAAAAYPAYATYAYAADAAADAATAAAAAADARNQFVIQLRDKLLSLLAEAPIPAPGLTSTPRIP